LLIFFAKIIRIILGRLHWLIFFVPHNLPPEKIEVMKFLIK
jgi:hypothetical protein